MTHDTYARERKESEGPTPLTIRTRVPSKWRMVDLETDDVWRWDKDREVWTRAYDVVVTKVRGEQG